MALTWGLKHYKQLEKTYSKILVAECGFIGNRLEACSLGWNGLNGRANFCIPAEPSLKRFESFAEIKPWKSSGNCIIIMGQVPGDASLRGKNLAPWYLALAKNLNSIYKLPVLFKPHPSCIKQRRHYSLELPYFTGTAQEAYTHAKYIAVWNSNSAVESVLAGCPTWTFDKGSMAWEVTGHKITSPPPTPERLQWAARLAYCQWSPQELRSGAFWPQLKSFLL
jgi:hypothetical protein